MNRSEPEKHLGVSGEAEWDRLDRQLEFAQGFWLGFLFTLDPLAEQILAARTRDQLLQRNLELVSFRPQTSEELKRTPEKVLNETGQGCLWVEALRADSPLTAQSPGPWEEAWRTFLARLNENREVLRRRADGGVVIVMPTHLKPLVRELAPDLWSIRSLVLQMPAVPRNVEFADTRWSMRVPKFDQESEVSHDLEAALEEVSSRRNRGGNPKSLAASLLRAGQASLQVAKPEEACEALGEAVELLRTAAPVGRPTLAESLYWWGFALQSKGDLDGAAEALREALEAGDHNDNNRLDWLELAAEISIETGDFAKALALRQDAMELAQRQYRATYHSETSALPLIRSQLLLGEALGLMNDREGAMTVIEEGLAVGRSAAETSKAKHIVWEYLSVMLNYLAASFAVRGDYLTARSTAVEAVEYGRRASHENESTSALGQLAGSLRLVARLEAELSKRRDSIEEGILVCERAIRLEPEQGRYWCYLAEFLGLKATLEGDVAESLELLRQANRAGRRAVQIDSGQAEFWNSLADNLRSQAKLESDSSTRSELLLEAVEAMEHAVKLDPDRYFYLGVCLEELASLKSGESRLEHLQQAVSAYRRATELAPEESENWFDLGAVLVRLSEQYDSLSEKAQCLNQAADVFNRSLELDPSGQNPARAHLAVSLALRAELETDSLKRVEMQEEALVLAQEAYRLTGNRYDLACTLARLSRLEEAFEQLRLALETGEQSWSRVDQDPDFERVRQHKIYEELRERFQEQHGTASVHKSLLDGAIYLDPEV